MANKFSDIALLNKLLNQKNENAYPSSPLDPIGVVQEYVQPGLSDNPLGFLGMLPERSKPEETLSKEELDNSIQLSKEADEELKDLETKTTPLPPAQLDNILSSLKQSKPVTSATQPTVLETEDDLIAAQDQARQLRLMGMLGRAGERIGTAIAGVKSDENYLKEILETADQPVKDILQRRESKSKAMQQEAAKRELDRDKEKFDSNSKISRAYRDTLKSFGDTVPGMKVVLDKIPEDISAGELEKLSPTLFNMVNAEIAREARKEVALTTASAKQDKVEEEKNKEIKKFTKDLRKEVTTGSYGKMYNNVTHAQKAQMAIDEFMKNPTGYSDYGTLMTSLKTLQGDESVVREAEIRLGMEAGSFKEKITNQIDRLRKGTSLQPRQRQNILNAVSILNNIATNQYTQAIQPVLEQAEVEGIDPKYILPGNIGKISTDKETKLPEYSPQQEAGITAFMNANKITDRKRAIDILKKAGKIK